MVKDKNQIYLIIGIIILAVIILPKLDTGLFAVGETCVSNEPNTLEGYKTICYWNIYTNSIYKCDMVYSNRLEITWGGVPKQGEFEEDIQVWTKNDWEEIIEDFPSDLNINKEKVRNGVNIYSFELQYPDILAKFYYFCSSKKATYKDLPKVDFGKYYNPQPNWVGTLPLDAKCIYERDPRYVSYTPCEFGFTENGNFCEFVPQIIDELGNVQSCRNNVASNENEEGYRNNVASFSAKQWLEGVPLETKQDYMCLLYADTAIEDKYFSTFYTCEEPQKCYSYLAETCQEVPCDSNSVKFNTLLECQNYYKTPLAYSCWEYMDLSDECIQKNYKGDVNIYPCSSQGQMNNSFNTLEQCKQLKKGYLFVIPILGFGVSLWMLLLTIGGIILLIVYSKK